MKIAVRILRWFGIALGLLIVVLLGGFGLLQTQAGQAWLARTRIVVLDVADVHAHRPRGRSGRDPGG
jgi:hypothetical protein